MIKKDGTYDLDCARTIQNIEQLFNYNDFQKYYQKRKDESKAFREKELLPVFEEIQKEFLSIHPTARALAYAMNYIDSDRGTFGQELAFSQDEDILLEDYG